MVPKGEHSGTNAFVGQPYSVVGSVAARGRWPLECERPLANGRLPAELKVTGRTFLRWLARYRTAEDSLGAGYLGLLPKSGGRGNCTPRLSEASRRLMEEFLEQDYETLKQKTRYASWVGLKLACENQGVAVPSYKTFCVAVKNQPALNQTLKRQGRRASYKLETFYWELDQKTPRHGDRPFEIVHVDHTELDVESVASTGQVLGRPWMTIATDAFSRRTLAFYLTFDAPSYRSCMMVLRECVRRFSRLPQILVVDGGREFESTYFETLLARYECTKKPGRLPTHDLGRFARGCSEPPTPSSSTICGGTPRSLAMFGRSPSPWIRKAWQHGRWQSCINDYRNTSTKSATPSTIRCSARVHGRRLRLAWP